MKWRRDVQVAIRHIFGKESTHINDFNSVRFWPNYSPSTESEKIELYLRGVKETQAILGSMIEEIQEFWSDDETLAEKAVSSRTSSRPKVIENNTQIFIVHGHDEAMKQSVARTIENLELEPVILHERPDKGRTIIKKFEDYADVSFAVVT